MTTPIKQIQEAAKRLTPDEVRERLAELDRESHFLRAVLRAALKVSPIRLSADPSQQGGQRR